MNNLLNFLRTLKSNGLHIQTVYDIGAHHGLWSKQIQQSVLHDSKFYLFEANPAYESILKSTNFPYLCGTVLSNPGRTHVEFFNGSNTGDSYYKETTKSYDNQGFISLPCITLDTLVSQLQLPPPDFIKIDTQGSELDILNGASNLIGEVSLIYIECPIIKYNDGAPCIQDYLDFFKYKNFIPIDIFEIHRSEDTLLQIDILFMSKAAKFKYLSKNDFIRIS